MRWAPVVLATCLLASGCLVARGLAGPTSAEAEVIEVTEGPSGEVHAVVVRGPEGSPVVEAQAGPADHGVLIVGGEPPVRGPARLTVVGDPLADDTVRLVAEVDGQRWVFEVHPTPAGPWQGSGAHRVVASPLAGPEAEVALAVGPVLLGGPGTVSPAYDLLAQTVLEDAQGYRPVGLALDGQTVARVVSTQADGSHRIGHASMPGYRWPASDQTELAVRVERELAPGLIHETLVARTALLLDRQGPAPPVPTVENGTVTWLPSDQAVAYDAQRRNASGAWRPVTTRTDRLGPGAGLEPGDDVRVRGVDGVGNPGPWSPPVTVPSPDETRPAPAELPDRWGPLAPGATVTGSVEVAWPARAPVLQARVLVEDPATGGWQPVAQARESPLVWETRVLPDGVYLAKLEVETPDGTLTRFFPSLTVANLAPLDPPPAGPGVPAAQRVEVPVPEPTSPLPVLATLVLGVAGAASAAFFWRRTGTAK